jgi:uncharacterized protein
MVEMTVKACRRLVGVPRQLGASLALVLLGTLGLRADASPGQGRPLLWVIEGTQPSYLFGTIHVPDARVLALAPSVDRALQASDALFTEIPMDSATQIGAMGKMMLPGEQRLRDVVGHTLFERFSRAVARSLPADAPAGTATIMVSLFERLKPWAAMSQLSILEYLPDLMAGRKPLDADLWTRAEAAGKTVAALETLEEQVAVFEAFTAEDQARMLELALEDLEGTSASGTSRTRRLVDVYLKGDEAALAAEMNDSMTRDRALFARFLDLALDKRNIVIADRIVSRRAEQPSRVCFFAVGAAHYAGDSGIISLLRRKGLTVRRVESAVSAER